MNTQYGYFVNYRYQCPHCEGEGVIKDPTGLWREFKKWEEEQYPNGAGCHIEGYEEKAFEWWQNHGMAPVIYGELTWQRITNAVPEELPCEECRGEGFNEMEMPLEEAIKALGI
jgi:DnaJ-class molecular chaperone